MANELMEEAQEIIFLKPYYDFKRVMQIIRDKRMNYVTLEENNFTINIIVKEYDYFRDHRYIQTKGMRIRTEFDFNPRFLNQ